MLRFGVVEIQSQRDSFSLRFGAVEIWGEFSGHQILGVVEFWGRQVLGLLSFGVVEFGVFEFQGH